MARFEDLAERVDRLLLRNRELKRTTSLIADQLLTVTADRDSLKSRLSAARARVDALLSRLPADDVAPSAGTAPVPQTAAPAQATPADIDSKAKKTTTEDEPQAGST